MARLVDRKLFNNRFQWGHRTNDGWRSAYRSQTTSHHGRSLTSCLTKPATSCLTNKVYHTNFSHDWYKINPECLVLVLCLFSCSVTKHHDVIVVHYLGNPRCYGCSLSYIGHIIFIIIWCLHTSSLALLLQFNFLKKRADHYGWNILLSFLRSFMSIILAVLINISWKIYSILII